jgi:hypothetical protein
LAYHPPEALDKSPDRKEPESALALVLYLYLPPVDDKPKPKPPVDDKPKPKPPVDDKPPAIDCDDFSDPFNVNWLSECITPNPVNPPDYHAKCCIFIHFNALRCKISSTASERYYS